jgi:hypothetical protein
MKLKDAVMSKAITAIPTARETRTRNSFQKARTHRLMIKNTAPTVIPR